MKRPRRNWCTKSPDWLPFIGYFGYCCRIHDDLYCYGGSEVDRLWADLQLRKCIVAQARARGSGRLRHWWARKVARIYYKAVVTYGKSHFNHRLTYDPKKVKKELDAD